VEAVSYYGKELLSLFDLQIAIVATDGDMLLGKWLEKAKRHGKTDAERAYFEWNARVQITLWADREGAIKLRDYAAKEWQGLLEDFYRPRWESFISRLEISLLTDRPLEEIRYYDEELPFVYRKNVYTTTPFGDLRDAVCAALDKIRSTKIVHQVEKEKQASFVENVMKDIGE
jgi:alpha-N-acetylglucosaminidase